jgi:uncharacterized damage-inducible protein DinB
MDRSMIDQYQNGGEKLSLAIRGLTREDLLCPPPTDSDVGRWTIQQVVMHLVDCELVYADRMKRVIAEDNPTLQGFDQDKWLAALQCDAQPADEAVALLNLARQQMARVLRGLPDGAFSRSGTHSEYGNRTLGDLVEGAVRHMEHHLGFIHRKRAAMGKEMW